MGGEPIELLVAGNVVATAMTGGDGRALLVIYPEGQRGDPIRRHIGTTSWSIVMGAEEGENLIVWERRSPDDGGGDGSTHGGRGEGGHASMPDAARELGKLTQFYYNVLYVMTENKAVGLNDEVNAQARQ